MRNIKLTIQYDGTDFSGWQVQPRQRTVQEELERVAKLLFHSDVDIQASGRTDRGVHALGQVAHFKTESAMPADKMLRAFNANLPDDISILDAQDVPLDFHARFDAKSKIYRYVILNRPAKPALDRQYCFHCPFKLDVGRMERELTLIHGTHDFLAFQGSHPFLKKLEEPMDTVRTILRTTIRQEGDLILVDIEGDGFLYKMVRNIMGIVIRVGSGMIPEGSLGEVLRQKNKALVKYTAKAQGLVLLKVNY